MGEAEFESKALVEAVQGALAETPPPSVSGDTLN